MTGNDISCKLDIEVQPDAPAPAVKYLRGGRELKNDSRTKITTQGNKSTMMIRRSRFTDEAKYTAILEQDGVQVDEATWSVFVKGNFLFSWYCIQDYFRQCVIFTLYACKWFHPVLNLPRYACVLKK